MKLDYYNTLLKYTLHKVWRGVAMHGVNPGILFSTFYSRGSTIDAALTLCMAIWMGGTPTYSTLCWGRDPLTQKVTLPKGGLHAGRNSLHYPDPRWDLSFVLRKKIQGRTARLLKLKVPGILRSEMNVVVRRPSCTVLRRESGLGNSARLDLSRIGSRQLSDPHPRAALTN